MWSRATPVRERARTDGLELFSIWDISASATYHVRWDAAWNAGIPANAHVAWLTLRGGGRVTLRDGRCAEPRAGTLFFTRCHDLAEYACTGGEWRFFWVLFAVPVSAQLPVLEPFQLPARSRSPREIMATIRALRKGSAAQRALAAATFQKLFLEWLALMENQRRNIPHLSRIERVIEAMHNRLDGSLSLPALAETAGMSEVVFRRRFKDVTGRSPKQFYLGLRLDQAEALLRLGQHSAAEVADTLGFHDPFHFSKTFSRRFGKPPSKWGRPAPDAA